MKTASIALVAGIVGCAFAQPTAAANAVKYTEKVLYSFGAFPDGEVPYAGLTDVKGTLYGTTYVGGENGFGAVFALDRRTSAEKIEYSLEGEAFPQAGLIDAKGTLYGTASGGGEAPGTVFAFDLSTGAGKTVYTFCSQGNCADGATPLAALINVKGTLYGTTLVGGSTSCSSGGCGVVFSVDPRTGTEKVLFTFLGGRDDGAYPSAGLIDVNGTLYGTTSEGGLSACPGGCGIVFSIDPGSGAEKVIYSFCSQSNCADGVNPGAGLIDVNGMLYGTTNRGGAGKYPNCSEGCGTVFSIDPTTSMETVLYSFCNQSNCADGAEPVASLIDVNGALYGTTSGGGTGCGGAGCGTVFSVDPTTGAEKVLHAFLGSTDGAFPFANLIDVKGNLYGTTYAGGADQKDCGSQGCGTVFVLKQKH